MPDCRHFINGPTLYICCWRWRMCLSSPDVKVSAFQIFIRGSVICVLVLQHYLVLWCRLIDQRPSSVIQSFCVPSEKTPRSLFEVCAKTEGRREGTQICCPIHQGEPLHFSIRALNMKAWRAWIPWDRKLDAPQHSTEAAVEESERIFSRLIRSIEKQSCEVKELIRVQERAAVSQAEELLETIQRETVALRRADDELETLSSTVDHIHFLQVGNKRERSLWCGNRLQKLAYLLDLISLSLDCCDSLPSRLQTVYVKSRYISRSLWLPSRLFALWPIVIKHLRLKLKNAFNSQCTNKDGRRKTAST